MMVDRRGARSGRKVGKIWTKILEEWEGSDLSISAKMAVMKGGISYPWGKASERRLWVWAEGREGSVNSLSSLDLLKLKGCARVWDFKTLFAKHRLLARSPVRKSSKNIDVWEIWLQRKFYEELMSHKKFIAMKETLKNIVCSGPLRIESWAFILALFPHHPLRLFFRSLILMVLDE